MTSFYVLNPGIAAVSRGDAYYVLRPERTPLMIPATAACGLARILKESSFPISDEQANKALGETTKRFLVDEQILLSASRESLLRNLPKAITPRPCRHLVLGLTGAVASMQVAPVALGLRTFFADEVDVVLTASAQSFVNAEALSLLGLRAWTDTFSPKGEVNVPHVYLGNAAELIVVMPASAHTLYKVASGACSDLLSLTIAATRAPVIFVPAMNRLMWSNAAISRNVERLREDGYYILEPGLGLDVAHGADSATELGSVMGLAQFTVFRILKEILELHRSASVEKESRKGPAPPFVSVTR